MKINPIKHSALTQNEAIQQMQQPCTTLWNARISDNQEDIFTTLIGISKLISKYEHIGLDSKHVFHEAQRRQREELLLQQ